MNNVIIYDTYNVNVTIEENEVVGVQVVAGFIHDVIAGTNISIDKTDPLNPIISSSGGGGSSYTFSNGLTESGGTVKLGGSLTENTQISDDATHTFGIGDSGANQGILDFRVFAKDYLGLRAGEFASGNYSNIFMIPTGVSSGLEFSSYDSDSNKTEVFVGTGTGQYFGFTVMAGNPTVSRKFQIRPDGLWHVDLGSDATGDTYYRNSSGYFTRLPAGTDGHVLTLASGIPSWAAPSGGGGTWGSITGTLSSQTDLQSALDAKLNLTGATYTTTTGNGLDITSSTVTSGNLVSITNTGTAAASDTKTALFVGSSGANATSGEDTYAARFSNTNTGTASTNVAVYANASGATNNMAIHAPNGAVVLAAAPSSYNGRLHAASASGGRVAMLGALEITTSAGPSYSGAGIQVAGNNRKMVLYGGNFSIDNDMVNVSWGASNAVRTGIDLGIFNASLGAFTTSTFQAQSMAGFRFIDTWPTLTNPMSVVYGFDYSPAGGGNSTSEIAFRATQGKFLMGTTITAGSVLADFQSTTLGVVFPRMTTTQKNAIATPVAGMVIYDTTLNKLCVYTTAWETITSL